MPVDVESLLQPVSNDKPSGVDLVDTLDSDYTQIRALIEEAAGKGDEGMVDAGESDPNRKGDWKGVRDRCVKLFGRTKDVRVATCLALALLQTEGLPGLRDGLRVLREMLERYWESVFPELDREDGDDPTRRMNAVASLSPPPGARGDVMRFGQRLKETPLCGRVRPIDVAIARGEVAPVDPSAPKPDPAAIEAAFRSANLEQLESLAAAAGEAKEQLVALDDFLTARVGNNAPNLQAFKAALGDVHVMLQRHLSARTGQEAPMSDDGGAAAGIDAGGNGHGSFAPRGTAQRLSGEIGSDDDVRAALDKVCAYYERYEKSSPVPLFLRAARKMVARSYLEIFEILTPDAVQQLRTIGAPDETPAE
jgi:type VI secretion system protein ImpA